MTFNLAFCSVVFIALTSPISPAVIPSPVGHKCGAILGIPMTAEASGNSNSPIQYILPVTNMGQHNCSQGKIVPMGMIPLRNFEFEMMPLKSYLQQYTVPSYVKFSLANLK